MRLCFNIDLPDTDLRVGRADMSGRSLVGTEDRQWKRFYPIIECLEILCRINEWHWARHAMRGLRIAPLYQSGVVYRPEPPGEEEWLDVIHLYRQGWGDCEDLACARVGELRYAGVPAVPCIKHKKFVAPGKGTMTLIHVMVLLPDGTIEDPSAKLGMTGEYQ